MKNDKTDFKAEIASMTKELETISQTVRELNDPIGALKNYVEDMLEEATEDSDKAGFKDRLTRVDAVTNRCIAILRNLVDLTMPYFESLTKSKKS